MSYQLVIVESPAKSKTIASFLENTTVEASKGHIRDLPKFFLGVKINGDKVECVYEVTPDHKNIVTHLKRLAKDASKVYIATDEDREGEAIGYHVATVLNQDIKTVDRIAFHEITKSAILHAIQNPRKLNMNMVNSQQARRVLDRIVGYNLSGFLASKIAKGLTAGRVQSATLSIVVDREREIQSFVPTKYFVINGLFDNSLQGVLTSLEGRKLEQFELQEESRVKSLLDKLNTLKYKVDSITKSSRKIKPQPPFTTSTLQQTASNKLGYSPDRTMRIAQSLYEGVNTPKGKTGIITYMRTDSVNIAKEAMVACREHIKSNFGDSYLSPTPRTFTTSSQGAQEAHEAIRPSKIELTPEIMSKYLDDEQLKLYSLIYNRFLATQSTEAVFENTKCKVTDTDGFSVFEANGSILVFDGYQKFTGSESKVKVLPDLKEGHVITSAVITSENKETQPPGRYTEASLVSTMEKLGIGRPSTYASTTSLLIRRKYVVKEGKALRATDDAFKIVDTLRQYFPNIVDVKFTAHLEEQLDVIARGELDWEKFISSFYNDFNSKLSEAKTLMKSTKPEPIMTDEPCPKCGKPLVIRKGKFGDFTSCSGFPKCKYIKKTETPVEAFVLADFKCPICKSDVYFKKGKFGDYYECCKRADKKCGFIGKFKPIDGKKCEKCGGYLVDRYGNESCPKCKPAFVKFKSMGFKKKS